MIRIADKQRTNPIFSIKEKLGNGDITLFPSIMSGDPYGN